MLKTTTVTSRVGDAFGTWTLRARTVLCGLIALAAVAGLAIPAYAQEAAAESLWTTEVAVDTLWTLIAGILVFFMNAGFGCVEAGFCRAKNAVNILARTSWSSASRPSRSGWSGGRSCSATATRSSG